MNEGKRLWPPLFEDEFPPVLKLSVLNNIGEEIYPVGVEMVLTD